MYQNEMLKEEPAEKQPQPLPQQQNGNGGDDQIQLRNQSQSNQNNNVQEESINPNPEEEDLHYNLPPVARPIPANSTYSHPPVARPIDAPPITVTDLNPEQGASSSSASPGNLEVPPGMSAATSMSSLNVPGKNRKKSRSNTEDDTISMKSGCSAKNSAGRRSRTPKEAGCLVDLDHYFQNKDMLFVKQTYELDESLLGCESFPYKYRISDSHGHRVFSAEELMPFEGSVSLQCFFGNRRAFDMTIRDRNEVEVLYLSRPLNLCALACCFPSFCCCLQGQSFSVYSPADTLIGSVRQEWSLLRPKFTVSNAEGEIVMRIESQKRMSSGCLTLSSSCSGGEAELDLKIYSWDPRKKMQGDEIGQIKTRWPELEQKGLAEGKSYKLGIQFQRELESIHKSILLGACIYLSFTYIKGL